MIDSIIIKGTDCQLSQQRRLNYRQYMPYTAKAIIRLSILYFLLFFACSASRAGVIIDVGSQEGGSQTTGQLELWHDPDKNQTLDQVLAAYAAGEFKELDSAGSTGLQPGAFWSHFAVRNTTDETLTIQFEYVDHQLIGLEAYDKPDSASDYRKVVELSLGKPFSHRVVPHNRFVFELELIPSETHDIFVKFSSLEMGFVFPSMRIWQPDKLKASHTLETNVVSFLFGGFLVMSIFALVAGLTTNEKMFYAYSIYSLSKIVVWGTVLGYTHQYLLTENFRWSYMSISGATTILCGLAFARMVLQSRRYTPWLDKVLLLMMANSVFLLTCGVFELNTPAIVSITIALLLYPTLAVVAFVRWRQGSSEALVFGLAWSLLICGLVVQALRDMGFVSHTYLNYFWPPVASFTEMLTIMVAMGIRVKKFRTQKDEAEYKYRQQLENSKAELEILVQERTKELDEAKKLAETEAQTDPLTGIYNRRSFFKQVDMRISLARRKNFSICMLMLDIDHFKSVNDTYGHSAGDTALLAFSQELLKTVRDSDIYGRVGGEEFALLLNEEVEGALEFAERIREKVEGIRLKVPFSEITFTVSIGIARLEEEDSVESLLIKADTALYSAKENGRNCIVEFSAVSDQFSVYNK